MSEVPPSSHRLPAAPPEAWEPLVRVARLAAAPLERFLRIEAASGILLLACAGVALAAANSRWGDAYHHLWTLPMGIRIGTFAFERSLEWFVNDVLMAVFFFVVGLEIRREVHHGELSEWRRAALPAAAALGGMLAPALIYLAVASGRATHSGWGVPMATDIAFALGILTLLGKRVPPALRVLLLALAVIDDLGAIVVIAFFYSSGVAASGLLVAALGLGGIFTLQALGVRRKVAYVAPALIVWGGTYASGLHPTIAGVVIGLITPVRAWLGADGFVRGVERELVKLDRPGAMSSHELADHLKHVDQARREAMSPAESLIETLHPWVAFAIMPIFALANAGVSVAGVVWDGSATRLGLGVVMGLVLGKPLGVLLASFLALRIGFATAPAGIGSRQVVVLGVVAGIGFTMAFFIAQLAFADARLLAAAKLGVLAASGVAAALALVLGRLLLPPELAPGTAQSADEAESSTEA